MASVNTVLVSLRRATSVSAFLKSIRDHGIDPLVVARPVQWMITPSIASHLLAHDWDLLLILESDVHIPAAMEATMDASYTVRVELSSVSMLQSFREKNQKMLQAEEPPLLNLSKKPLRSLSSQRLELTPSLMALAHSNLCPKGPVSMLNYVSYIPYPHAAESYKRYVDHNKAGPMKRIGASVKFIGAVDSSTEKGEWDEVVLAQYPTLKHFCDMACDPDYQEGNYKWRLPVLRDTCILMTTEVDLEWTIQGSEKVKPEDNGNAVVIEPSE